MPEIKLEHITKRWGKFYAVEDLNLTIADNSFVTLLGPSGCGKTTTLRMIAGLETPTSGRITIGDQVVFDSAMGINVPANKRRVGFLFQNYALWPNMTVYENISFGLTNVKEALPKIDFDARVNARLAEILSAPGEVTKVLAECRDKKGKLDDKKALLKLIDTFTISQFTAKKLLGYHLEDGKDVSAEAAALREKAEAARKALEATGGSYDADYAIYKDGQPVTEVRKLTKEEIDLTVRRVARIVKIGMFMDRYPAELSGGQQQRVAIARTLAPEPSVLFMDEPLSNLDAKLRLEMRYELQRLHVETGSTFVYVTHDQMEAMTLAIEAYVSTAHCDYTDPLAIFAIRMIQGDLVDSYNGDMSKRDSMHNAQCLAGMAFSNALLGIVHSMAHKTGAAFADYGAHIIHGAANAMYLPKVIAFNAKDPEARKRYGVIADEMKLGGANDDEKVTLLIEYLRGMNDALNIPHCIQHYGPDSYPAEQGFVPEDVFLQRLPEIAKNAIADACTGSNPRQPSQEEMEKLLKCCYYDTEVDF